MLLHLVACVVSFSCCGCVHRVLFHLVVVCCFKFVLRWFHHVVCCGWLHMVFDVFVRFGSVVAPGVCVWSQYSLLWVRVAVVVSMWLLLCCCILLLAMFHRAAVVSSYACCVRKVCVCGLV